ALFAHDRAGFGGAVFTMGLIAFGCLWYSPITRALWETMLIAGGVSLTAAIGIHFAVGYTDAWHLTPPIAGAASLLIGLTLTLPTAYQTGGRSVPHAPDSPSPAHPSPP